MTWQPIETAPAETLVLICFDEGFRRRVTALYMAGAWWTYPRKEIASPTHWMPLPEPPS